MILDGKEINEIIISRQDGKLVNILNWDVTEMPISTTLPPSPERTVALRKLLESKDAAVRAYLAVQE